MSFNLITCKGCYYLADGLCENNYLDELILTDN